MTTSRRLNTTESLRTSTRTIRGCTRLWFGTVRLMVAVPTSPSAEMNPKVSTVAIRSPPGETWKTIGTGEAGEPSALSAR